MARGLTVLAGKTLSCHCEKRSQDNGWPIPLTSLMDDIAALEHVLERTSGPAVVVGHAYGGAVIAGPDDSR